MIWNFLKIFIRNSIKHPFYSLINVSGLSIGFATVIVAVLYISDQTGYNRFHKDVDYIYRIGSGLKGELFTDSMPQTLYEIAPALVNKVPEVASAARFVGWYQRSLVKVKNEFFPNVNVMVTDSALLDVFSFRIVQGPVRTFMQSPSQIAITESAAQRLFKGENPMHKRVSFLDETLEIAWVMEDPPKRSQIQFEILAPFGFKENLMKNLSLDVHTFFKLRKEINPVTEKKIRGVSDTILYRGFNDWVEQVNSPIQPFKDIYLHSNLGWEIGPIGSIRTLYIFGFLAVAILIIAMVNYINLLTSRSEYRGKEVGLRKVSGAQPSLLRFQFLGESVITAMISLFLGLVLGELLIYLVNTHLQADLSLVRESSPLLFLLFIFLAILTGILSGIYPSFILTKFQPVKIIKGIFQAEGKSDFLKVLLVIIQFSLSTFLLISIFIFSTQIRYLKTKQLGFDEKNLVVLRECTDNMMAHYESIRADLLKNPKIKHITASQSIPGWGRSGQAIQKAGDDEKKSMTIAENRVQDHYVETFGIQLAAGRSFTPEFNDSLSVILNETAVKKLGLENPIGAKVVTNDRITEVIGVAIDYHFYSTQTEIEPLYLSNYAGWFYNITLRMDPDDKPGTLEYIKGIVKKYDPDYYWNYIFVEDMFANMYKIEERLFTLIIWGAAIAVFLSVLGLFALASYLVVTQYKEMGIRKTFGASMYEIIYHVNYKMLRWVLLTNLIAWPAAYVVMKDWLQNYPYRVDIPLFSFILASIISFLIALITISVQAIKAARMNPVDAIRYE